MSTTRGVLLPNGHIPKIAKIMDKKVAGIRKESKYIKNLLFVNLIRFNLIKFGEFVLYIENLRPLLICYILFYFALINNSRIILYYLTAKVF